MSILQRGKLRFSENAILRPGTLPHMALLSSPHLAGLEVPPLKCSKSSWGAWEL